MRCYAACCAGSSRSSRARIPPGRAKTVQACRALMDRLILGMQHKFAEIAAEFVLPALAAETEPQVLREFADVLSTMTATSVQFADYQLASRILLDLRGRQRALKETGGREGDRLAALLDRRIEPAAILKLLEEDLRSGQPDRHERAAQVLGALGAVATPLLIDVIKQENDFRVRNLAAKLLAEADPQAPELVKRALVTEVIFEQRARLLEVIDMVTRDLRLELEQCLRDTNPRVRRAAFQLFERLGQDELVPLVAPFAQHSDPAVARGAIRALTSLRSPAAVHALTAILETTKDESLAALLCQGLGLSEQATAIDALARVLAEHKVFFFGRRWGVEVRGTAALALRQIPHPSVAEVLARYENDGNVGGPAGGAGRGRPGAGGASHADVRRTAGRLWGTCRRSSAPPSPRPYLPPILFPAPPDRMDWITSPEAWIALFTLTALEIVLGIDNIVFISILAGRLHGVRSRGARVPSG